MSKIFIVCSGLGHIKRGYESFTQECFNALSKSSLDITLFKGGGESSEKEVPLWILPRTSPIAIQLGKIIRKNAYIVEQSTFFLSLLPHIYRSKPDVIYFSDGNLGNMLWHWRRLTKQNYKLLFSNGGPLLPPFSRWEHVQQVAPLHLQSALDLGEPCAKHSLVPYGIHIPSELQLLSSSERGALKRRLQLPERPLILSVGTINKSHKRMDYVIREVARLSEPRPYLLLLGQIDAESPEIMQLGSEMLGTDNFQVRTVGLEEVGNYYKVADAFVLASLYEGFGRVLLEAMSYGLPCLAHDYPINRFILKDEGNLADFNVAGELASLIAQVLAEDQNEAKHRSRHRTVYERFSWNKLRSSYVEMIQKCANITEEPLYNQEKKYIRNTHS